MIPERTPAELPPVCPDEFADRMRALAKRCVFPKTGRPDFEGRHKAADELLCEALRGLGYHEGVEVFERFTKWYG